MIENIAGNITAIASLITGVAALITGIISIINTRSYRSQTICKFFEEIEAKEFIAKRKEIYNTDNIDPQSEDAAYVINFFHKWGQMVKLRYLPLKVFKSASRIAVIRLYNKLRPIILTHRQNNKLYAENFEWLYNRIRTKYKFDDII